MKNLSTMSLSQLQDIKFILTDIDDTLTSDGRLKSDAYEAMERLSDNGYIYNHNVSRTTGTYQYVELFEQKTPVCKKVEAIEFQDAKNKLEEYSQKVKDKRKI